MRTFYLVQLLSGIGLAFAQASSHAQVQPKSAPPKATVALVGDADRFNVGQDGFCGKRTEISSPSNAQFRVPADVRTYFFIKATFRTPLVAYYCEGDFSFIPQARKLHIVRYVMVNNECRLEVFKSSPGGTPEPMGVQPEETRSCLVR